MKREQDKMSAGSVQDPQDIDTILYTVESDDSTEETRADLKVEDPQPERAVAVLRGHKQHEPKSS